MEHFFACPYCGEQLSMVLDTSVATQTYIEDCEVCRRPIEVRYTVENDELTILKPRRFEKTLNHPNSASGCHFPHDIFDAFCSIQNRLCSSVKVRNLE
jgi:hypothetical protein